MNTHTAIRNMNSCLIHGHHVHTNSQNMLDYADKQQTTHYTITNRLTSPTEVGVAPISSCRIVISLVGPAIRDVPVSTMA